MKYNAGKTKRIFEGLVEKITPDKAAKKLASQELLSQLKDTASEAGIHTVSVDKDVVVFRRNENDNISAITVEVSPMGIAFRRRDQALPEHLMLDYEPTDKLLVIPGSLEARAAGRASGEAEPDDALVVAAKKLVAMLGGLTRPFVSSGLGPSSPRSPALHPARPEAAASSRRRWRGGEDFWRARSKEGYRGAAWAAKLRAGGFSHGQIVWTPGEHLYP